MCRKFEITFVHNELRELKLLTKVSQNTYFNIFYDVVENSCKVHRTSKNWIPEPVDF